MATTTPHSAPHAGRSTHRADDDGDDGAQPPLAELVMLGDHAGVAQALQAGADPNDDALYTEPGWSMQQCSPLYRAAKHGHTQVLGALLRAKADLAYVDKQGLTALHIAGQYGHAAAMQMLIAAGADVNVESYGFRTTPLHWAASYGTTACVDHLLRGSADPSLRNKKRQTALEVAVASGHSETVALLRDPPPDAARASGLLDRALLLGTRLMIEGTLGEGVYEGFERNALGANTHIVRFAGVGGAREMKLRGLRPDEWSVLPLPDTRALCRARQLLAFVCGTLEYTEAHHGDVQFEVLSAVCTLVAASELPPREVADRDAWDRVNQPGRRMGRARGRSTVSRESTFALLQGTVKVQWSGKGLFHDAHLELRPTRLTFRDRRGGKELSIASVAGLAVGYPKAARKGHPFSFRLDAPAPGARGVSKYICSVESVELCSEWMDAITAAAERKAETIVDCPWMLDPEPEPEPEPELEAAGLAEGVPPLRSSLQDINAEVAKIAREDALMDAELAAVQAATLRLSGKTGTGTALRQPLLTFSEEL